MNQQQPFDGFLIALLGTVLGIALTFGVFIVQDVTNTGVFQEPTVGGTRVPRTLDCFEDEVIAFVARDTLACVHIERLQDGTR